jgi:hypothetical protein
VDAVKLLAIMASALEAYNHPALNEVSFDCDNDSGEVIVTSQDGKVFVVKAKEDEDE